MQAFPFSPYRGLELTLLDNPRMEVGIPIETCKKKTKHLYDYNAKNLIIYHLMHLPKNFKYRD